jgi:hypothetical protein
MAYAAMNGLNLYDEVRGGGARRRRHGRDVDARFQPR